MPPLPDFAVGASIAGRHMAFSQAVVDGHVCTYCDGTYRPYGYDPYNEGQEYPYNEGPGSNEHDWPWNVIPTPTPPPDDEYYIPDPPQQDDDLPPPPDPEYPPPADYPPDDPYVPEPSYGYQGQGSQGYGE